MLPAVHGLGQRLIEKPLFQEEPDYPPSPEFLEGVASTDRDEVEAVMIVESALEDDGIPMRVPAREYSRSHILQMSGGLKPCP